MNRQISCLKIVNNRWSYNAVVTQDRFNCKLFYSSFISYTQSSSVFQNAFSMKVLCFRLFFLYEGSNKSREVIKLREIKSIEKITQNSFLSQVPALRINSNSK